MKRILLIRMIGLGDVASILVPAVRLFRAREPATSVSVLTYAAGVELMALMPEVDALLAVQREQWPDDLHAAIRSFSDIAKVVDAQGFDEIVNLDTWFMPCYLARLLRDSGRNVAGNVINQSLAELSANLQRGRLDAEFFRLPARFLDSSFPAMRDWTIPWWEKFPEAGAYPEFYLRHCCGLEGKLDHRLGVEADGEFRTRAQGRPIIALSLSGSKATKQYRMADLLHSQLERAGYFVWTGFDGSAPMAQTLGRLAVTNLLVTVATSTQWLAKLVGCPSLVLPGPLPPTVLGAEAIVDRMQKCQYCYQSTCRENLDFACMDVPPGHIVEKVRGFLAGNST